MKVLLLAGKPIVVSDAATSQVIDQALKQLCGRLNIGAYLQVPLIKQGQLVAKFCITQDQPRNWTALDIQLARETAERTEAARRQSEAQYRTLFEAIDEGFCLIEVLFDEQHQPYNHRFIQVNPAFERLTGLTDLVGQTARQRAPQIADHWHALYAQVLTSGQPLRQEQYSPALDRIFEVYLCPLGEAAPDSVAVLFSDITERRRTQEALLAADRRKDEFLAMLAHELRNPMATLTHTLAVLKVPLASSDALPWPQALALMRQQITHLNRLVDDLLDVSRITRGKIELRRAPAELGQLVREALGATGPELAARGQFITQMLGEEPLWVLGDATRLAQVVRNLLSNASKYTPNGGRIGVSLKPQAGQVVLRVKDTGVGLAADQLESIFEVFVQVATSLDRPQGGLGLGLAVVKQLVELHGGRVSVRSSGLGQGSEFTVRLPQVAEPPPVNPSLASKHRLLKAKPRLMLVDDQADLARVRALFLRTRGYEVQTCLSGREALASVEGWQPDVVLLDLGMPGLDGYATARALRQLSWSQQGLIVALSGYGQVDDRARTRAAGFDGHLLKPLREEALKQVLSGWFDGNGELAPPPASPPDDVQRQRSHDLKSTLGLIELAIERLQHGLAEPERDEMVALLKRTLQGLTAQVAEVLA